MLAENEGAILVRRSMTVQTTVWPLDAGSSAIMSRLMADPGQPGVSRGTEGFGPELLGTSQHSQESMSAWILAHTWQWNIMAQSQRLQSGIPQGDIYALEVCYSIPREMLHLST